MAVKYNVKYNRIKNTAVDYFAAAAAESISIHSPSLNHWTEAHNHRGWSREVKDGGVALREDRRENWWGVYKDSQSADGTAVCQPLIKNTEVKRTREKIEIV